MAEEIDDNEFFQQDFTTASEWEIFNARLDEIFHDWKLPFAQIGRELKSNELFSCSWKETTENIFFADIELCVKHYKATLEDDNNQNENQDIPTKGMGKRTKLNQVQLDLMSLENNFNTKRFNGKELHPLACWYGLREFVVIEPVDSQIINESQIRVLLSSVSITVAESNIEIPVFIHVMPNHLNVFLGVGESNSIRINFDIVALEKIPTTCRHLSGLLYMFKEKVSTHRFIDPVNVSIRFTYNLHEFLYADYAIRCKIPLSLDYEEDEEENLPRPLDTKFYAIPYGVSIDPVSELILNCTWPEVAENVIVDSPTYTDLDPMLAPFWSVRMNFQHKRPPLYFLTDAIMEYEKLVENTRSLTSVLGSSYELGSTQNLDGSNPLDLLTESKIPVISNVLSKDTGSGKKGKQARKYEGAIKEEELMQMLYYMFPDAQSYPAFPYENDDDEKDKFDPLRIKSAIPDSLVFRLSTLLATCNSYFGGVSAVAHLWAEFTQEMRYRVERCIQIRGVAQGFPDSRTCLLHQKLQMLNICMERRRLREGGIPFSLNSDNSNTTRKSEDENDEDEFFDCDSNDDSGQSDSNSGTSWRKPEGRLSKLGDLTLIDSTEPLYIPVTQEPVPKTEDQLEDDTEVMLKLGPGSELCTLMMSASLLSDMESFKAANPNGKLEDFIRWYSPRDWIEETDEEGKVTGHLSQRMLIPGNTWQTVWNQSKPVPVQRQRRLFDDTKEAEKVLHYFETRTIGQICELTLPALCHSALLKIKREMCYSNLTDNFNDHIDKIMNNLCKLSRENWITTNTTIPHCIPSIKKWENLINELSNLEQLLIRSNSIGRKLFASSSNFNETQKQMILSILNGYEIDLTDGARNPISVRLLNMFSDARQSKDEFNSNNDNPSQLYLPDPVMKEYILRVNCRTKSSKVEGGPQFLRAILDNNLRLCGAFSQNTTFL